MNLELTWIRRREVWLVVGVCLLALLPFVNKALHIDDPVYVWVAQHIHEHPFDFFGFDINWHNRVEPVHEVNKNPPGVSYFIALAALFLGWSEPALHAAFLLPAIAAALGTYALARKWTRMPMLATFIAILSPVFLVSSTNLMADTLALACYVWTIALWDRGIQNQQRSWLVYAVFTLAAGVLVKYTVLTAIPLLAAYTYFRATMKLNSFDDDKVPVDLRNLFLLLIPIAILAAYEIYTTRLYGAGMIAEAMSFSSEAAIRTATIATPYKIAAGLAFVGGCYIALAFCVNVWFCFGPFIWSFACATITLVLLVNPEFGALTHLYDGGRFCWEFLLLYGLLVTAGIHVLALALREAFYQHDAISLTLLCWIAGIAVFSIFINWTVNARTLLPMAPAVGILAARALARSSGYIYNYRPLIPGAVIALAVTVIDHHYAETNRSIAEETARRIGETKSPVWFQGRWGQRYYWEALGYHSIAAQNENAEEFDFDFQLSDIGIQPGDLIVIAENHQTVKLPAAQLELIDRFTVSGARWGSTMNRDTGAGFYQYNWGPLPFAFGPASPEVISIYRAIPE